jgi:hypothetical protein
MDADGRGGKTTNLYRESPRSREPGSIPVRLAVLGALLLALAGAAGCTTSGSSASHAPPTGDVVVHVVGYPWQSQLVWFVTIHDNSTKTFDDVRVTWSVEKRGGIPDGSGQDDTTVAPGKDGTLRFATTNLGLGDYTYDVAASTPDGMELGVAHGVYENCAC